MLKIKKSKIVFNSNEELARLKRNLIVNTFKSNLNYNYLFYFIYAKGSNKSFVGNWESENSFWLIRKENTYFKFRPYVVTIGKFDLDENTLSLEIKIPVVIILTLVIMSYFMIIIMFYFITIFTIIFFPLFLIVYFLLLNDEVENTIQSIKTLV